MRQLNEMQVKILECIEEHGPLTYAELMEMTGASLNRLYAAVHTICPQYLDSEVIEKEKKRGKPKARISATERGFDMLDAHREADKYHARPESTTSLATIPTNSTTSPTAS
jgi:hypothetical protein